MASETLRTRRRSPIVALALVLAAGAGAVHAPVAAASIHRRSIVVFAPSTTPAERVAAVRAAGGRVVRDLHLIDGLGVVATRTATARLADRPGVRSVTADSALRPTSAVRPSQTATTSTGCVDAWCSNRLATSFVQSTRTDRAWNDLRYHATGAGVGVAVIDTGIAGGLQDFLGADGRSRVIAAAVVNPDATTAEDRYGHGTHVAGLVAGNGRRLAPGDPLYNRYMGTAPDANLISIKTSDDQGDATVMDVIAGLQFAVDFKSTYGIRVVNLSLNSTTATSYHSDPLDAAAEAAWFAGLVVVTSAGNRGAAPDAVSYAPANDPFVISVGGVDDQQTKATSDDALASWSSRGTTQDGFKKPDLVAPAAHIVAPFAPDSLIGTLCAACVVDGRYFRMSGTSMASPIVAGIAADLLSAHPDWTPNMVKQALVLLARPVTGSTRGEVTADLPLYARPTKVTANDFLKPNDFIDPTTHTIDYTRASWSRASWSQAADILRASWSRASWSCTLCATATATGTGTGTGTGTAADANTARASWGRASWSGFLGDSPATSDELAGGTTGQVAPDPVAP